MISMLYHCLYSMLLYEQMFWCIYYTFSNFMAKFQWTFQSYLWKIQNMSFTTRHYALLTVSTTYLNTTITNIFCTINTPTGSKSIFNLTACTLQVTCFGLILHTLCLTTSFKQKLIFNYVLWTTVYSANCTYDHIVFWNSITLKYKVHIWLISSQL